MRNPAFAARSHIRSVVLCSLVTFGLAACASDAGSSGSAAASASPGTLVAPSVGVIDRSAGATAGTTQGATPASSATTPASNSTIPASSSTTVASTDKGSKPVTTTPPGGTVPPVGTTPPVTTSPPPKSASTGTATLDWTPPTENSDGSSLTNLAGYTVYYGTSADTLTESVKISNPGLTAYTVSNLTSGTWYFAVTSYSSTGVESIRSGVISAKI
jgi:hypothetical protein